MLPVRISVANPLLPQIFGLNSVRWATNLGGGNTQNGRDSAGRRLGIKKGNGTL